MGASYSQFFPPPPTLTESNLPSQSGKVFIVTGGAAGVGYELSKILYHAGGKVYIAGRSEKNANWDELFWALFVYETFDSDFKINGGGLLFASSGGFRESCLDE
ncbi:Short-chain dehydrogenase/reductase sthC [Pseudocercospora fuligena]|uniref:Short-chain dehydrogenase/reductase sthC n=1 Tax=Pseudocercospora fuligena TaxID=685502 RepID=A0A8H6RT96_9PEZI|nr:Short-chain dehydrogenase/reductase sthC [Pseudocercospora fuligena]